MNLYSTPEILKAVARRAGELRIAKGLRQSDLAHAAGLSLSTIQRFEQTGEVAFDAVVRIAMALEAERDFLNIFPAPDMRSLDELLKPQRKRVRPRNQR
jgi:transcriptional regulator with XRE-family HTH domain